LNRGIRIFVSVGTQLPFPRMINMLKEAFLSFDEGIDVIWQVGGVSEIPLVSGVVRKIMAPAEYKEAVEFADVLISHSGMGSILTAMEYRKPIIIIPRLYEFQEHRNDHQLSTAREFGNNEGIYIANNSEEILELIKKTSILEIPSDKAENLEFERSIINFIER
jgi:UDP-N-acetylglucosamine transferase subunit ALG13